MLCSECTNEVPKAQQLTASGPRLGLAWSGLVLARQGWLQGWRPCCQGPGIWRKAGAPLPHSQGAPGLFVLSQQLSIEMNAICRGFTSDKCPCAAAARILMCALEFNGRLS